MVRARAVDLDSAACRSLAELGAGLARADHEVSADEARALRDLEESLGLSGPDAVSELLGIRGASPRLAPSPATRRIDHSALAIALDGGQRDVMQRVRSHLAELGAPPVGLSLEEHRSLTSERVVELGAMGLAAYAYPDVIDGGDLGKFLAVFETLAYGDVSLLVKYGVQYGLFGGSIYFLGNSEQRSKYLPDVAAGRLLGCFAMTETGHGSNVMKLGTVARYLDDSGEIEITTEGEAARKDYIGNAARDARLATVFAQLEVGGVSHGVHAILVPIRNGEGQPLPGVRIGDDGHKLGLGGVDNGRLWFDGVRVPRENLLGRFASIDDSGAYQSPINSPNKRFFTMLSTLVGGRVAVASGALSASKVGLAIAIRYAEHRAQFGPGEVEQSIMDYTSHQRRLLPRLATTYAVHAAIRKLQADFCARTDESARDVEALAAGLKAYATRHNTDTLQECREACGGAGYLSVNRIGPLEDDTDVFTTFEGDNTVLMLLVAKSLLGAFKDQFNDSRPFALLRFIARRAATELSEKNPVAIRRTASDHLRDRDFQLGALRYREDDLVRTVAMRMKKRLDSGMGAFDAMNQVQPHLLCAARAHVERVIAECFYNWVEEAGLAASEGDAVHRLVDLFCLSRIEADVGWFLEQGVLEAGKAKAIRKEVTALCREVRPDAGALVEAFAIPEPSLAAPIAVTDVPAAD